MVLSKIHSALCFSFCLLIMSACQWVGDGGGVSVSDEASDSLQKTDSALLLTHTDTVKTIPADSFVLRCCFVDQAFRRLRAPISFLIEHDEGIDTFFTQPDGVFEKSFKLETDLFVRYGETHLLSLFSQAGGTAVTEEFVLDVMPVYGKIMDKKGTPLVDMPVWIYVQKSRKERPVYSENDICVKTDSVGRYIAYVDVDAYRLVLRACSFVVGSVARSEWRSYPEQNFLFDPLAIFNRCDGFTPEPHFSVVFPEWEGFSGMEEPVRIDAISDLIPIAQRLEEANQVTIHFECEGLHSKRNIKKSNRVFRRQEFQVCF